MYEYNYTIQPESRKPIVQINKHIGFDSEDGQGIDGMLLSREFFELDKNSPDLITTYINCMGGDVQQSYDIFNSIANCVSPTLSVINGFAFSSGGWIPFASKKVYIYDHAIWMCHLPIPMNETSKNDSFLNIIANGIAKIISDRSGKNGFAKKSQEEIKAMMQNKTYLDANGLYNMGLVDKVLTSSNKVKTFNLNQIKIEDSVRKEYREYQKVFNKFIPELNNNNIMAFEKVINRLQLAQDSTEQDVLGAIARMENESTQNKEKIQNLSKEISELSAKNKEIETASNKASADLNISKQETISLTEKVSTLNQEKDALALELEKFKAEKVAIENSAKKEKASNLVQKFVDCGKIKNEEKVISSYVDMAVENYERTEAILESMATNFSLPKIDSEGVKNAYSVKEQTPGKPEYYRAQNRARIAEQKAKADSYRAS